MSNPLFQGSIAPAFYKHQISTVNADLTAGQIAELEAPLAPGSISLKVLKPDGTEATWQPQASSFAADVLTATFSFHASVSELDLSGDYRIYATYLLGSGTVRSGVEIVPVYDRYSKRAL